MNFCSQCGGPLVKKIPEGDNRERHLCGDCGTVHYQNPKIVTGSIPEWENRILLCRRAISPRYGYWTLPAGFLENGETSSEGAVRETLEEAKARIEVTSLYATFSLPHIDQVYLMFRARLLELDFGPGEESLEVALFEESGIPWDELAFPVIAETLKLYFVDRANNVSGNHVGDILRKPGDSLRHYRVRIITG